MKRDIIDRLVEWKDSSRRKPLLLTGVRQCGKTHTLKEFGSKYFKNVCYINFEADSKYTSVFDYDFDVERILREITLIQQCKITEGETLLIFDEIQEAPRALTALKYFCENKRGLHIACAGSLLGVAIKHQNISFPVGKVNRMRMYPLSFKEFVSALGYGSYLEMFSDWSVDREIPSSYVKDFEKLLKEYYIVGGMPEPKESDIRESRIAKITKTNFMQISIYLAVRHCIKADWLNDRDQFLYPNDGWKNDNEFQTNCLIYTLFLGQNRIRGIWNADGSSAQIAGEPPALHVNHWIPFSEKEVGAKSLFDSHFMKDFLDGKIKPAEKQNGGLFSTTVETRLIASLQYSDESNSVLSAGRDLWKYYHTMTDANPNASLYDIKEYFQGRNDKGKMNPSSNDPIYTELLENLKKTLRVLGEKIKPKVYEYGFLRE